MKAKILACLIVLFVCTGLLSSAQENIKQRSNYDVAAFVWPSYHPGDRAKIFWPNGIGEWQTVISNKPKFENHQQPRYPLWGYINEADPYVAEMEINAAADHGVNVFIFDWYWYDGMPFLEGHLNDGYLKARNNNKVKFYLMWANHDVHLNWDKRNADDAFTQKNTAKIWKGAIDRDEFERICNRFIDKYFSHPSYYRINNKPVFMLYRLDTFIEGMGGVSNAKEALNWFRDKTKEAGYEGLEIQYSMRRDGEGKIKVNEQVLGTEREIIDQLGINSLTHYVIAHMTNVNRNYNEVMQDVVPLWEKISSGIHKTYYPQVSVGWDASPRAHKYRGSIVKNNTPKNFENALRKAKKYIDEHPNQAPLITINSWNEWTETSYLQPCTMYGYGYLNAVKNVFVNDR